ncbi:MAG: alpha/beta hydrolase [Bacteroidia bacterium]
MQNKKRNIYKWLIISLLVAFILMNIIAYNNAYHFTHFSEAVQTETNPPGKLNFAEKLNVLFFGVRKLKSEIDSFPSKPYTNVIILNGNDTLRCWLLDVENSKGLILSFHGYTSNKSRLLPEANTFTALGYDVLLVDQRGHGESTGNTTTIGYYEAQDVEAAYRYALKNTSVNKIYLHGISMGGVAVLRAVSEKMVSPAGIIAECPYGSMLHAAENRFAIMGVPSFPSAHLLVFWGGLQNGFWAFKNNTIADAKKIETPVLLHYGEKDEHATPKEVQQIYSNLKGQKSILAFPNAGHESYCKNDSAAWKRSVSAFLNSN